MTPDEAAWVRDNAWSDALRTINGDYEDGWFFYRACHCQLGVCVPCETGRCDRCLTRQHEGRRLGDGGSVLKGMYPCARVYDARYDCHWLCPCDCWRDQYGPGQIHLFEAVA